MRSPASPLTFIGTGTPRRPATYAISPAGTYRVLRRRRRPSRLDHLHLCDQRQLRPRSDADLQSDRHRFRRREGQQGSRSASRVDPFSLPTIQTRRMPLADESIRRHAGRGARPKRRSNSTGRASARRSRAHEICDEIVIGPIVAQTILQRQLYVRAHFTFKLSWEYCLLDPMDIVTISDANLGLTQLSGPHHRDRGGRQGTADHHR